MIVYPAIDLLGGKVVRMTGGKRGTEWVVSEDPVALARQWEARGAKALHVVDLDRAFGTGDNRAIVGEILDASGCPVHVGGGVREDRDVDELLDLGAEGVVVGTRGVLEPPWLARQAERHPGLIVFAVDANGRQVVVKGWTQETSRDVIGLLQETDAMPLKAYLYTNVNVEGRAQGVDWAPIEEVVGATKRSIIVSGGVTTLAEVERLRDLGAAGVVLGTALYRGEIEFEQACRIGLGM